LRSRSRAGRGGDGSPVCATRLWLRTSWFCARAYCAPLRPGSVEFAGLALTGTSASAPMPAILGFGGWDTPNAQHPLTRRSANAGVHRSGRGSRPVIASNGSPLWSNIDDFQSKPQERS
jgi:hypothetical protein